VSVAEALAAVLAAPDDLLVRLLYAEALDGQSSGGDPRAELIRVQCALVAETDRSARIGLRARATRLLREHGSVWRAPLRAAGADGEFRRGFVEKVRVPMWRGLPKAFAGLFEVEPVCDVEFGYAKTADGLRAFFATGLVKRLTHLRMSADAATLAALCAAEGAEGLRYLGLRGASLSAEGLALVAGSERLAALDSLCLARLDDAGLATLSAGPRRWHALYLSSGRVTGQGVAAQCQTPAWEGLAVLCLNRCEEVDDAALVALAASPASAALRILELEGTAIGAAGARALVASPYLTGLTRLRVRGTRAAKGATLKALRARWPRAVIA